MDMKRPLIGITSDYNDKQTEYALPYWYCDAVEKAGGVPIILAYRTDASLVTRMVDALDGVIFSGGCDIDPKAYGQAYHSQAEPIDPARERFERALMLE